MEAADLAVPALLSGLLLYFGWLLGRTVKRRIRESLLGRQKRTNYRLRRVIKSYAEAYSHLIDEEEVKRLEEKYLADAEEPGELSEELRNSIEPQALAARLEERVEEGIKEGVSLGRRAGAEEDTAVSPRLRQPEELRFRHTYVVGKTGYGKTNLIRHLAFQDLKAGRGVGILTPEADLIRDKVLPFIPEDRVEDVIYFNPGDQERPVPLTPSTLRRARTRT